MHLRVRRMCLFLCLLVISFTPPHMNLVLLNLSCVAFSGVRLRPPEPTLKQMQHKWLQLNIIWSRTATDVSHGLLACQQQKLPPLLHITPLVSPLCFLDTCCPSCWWKPSKQEHAVAVCSGNMPYHNSKLLPSALICQQIWTPLTSLILYFLCPNHWS